MVPAAPALAPPAAPQYLGVHLDGLPIGFVEARAAPRLAARLRAIKAGRLASEMGLSVPGLAPLRVGHFIHNPCLCGCLLVSFLEGVEGSLKGAAGDLSQSETCQNALFVRCAVLYKRPVQGLPHALIHSFYSKH